jgi:hypothetical protein
MGGIVVCKAQKPPIGRHSVVGGGAICGGCGGDSVGQVKKTTRAHRQSARMLQDILDGGNAIIVKKRPTKIYRIMEKPRVLFEECPALGGYTLTVRDDWSYKPKKVSVTPQEKEAYEKHFGNKLITYNEFMEWWKEYNNVSKRGKGFELDMSM